MNFEVSHHGKYYRFYVALNNIGVDCKLVIQFKEKQNAIKMRDSIKRVWNRDKNKKFVSTLKFMKSRNEWDWTVKRIR